MKKYIKYAAIGIAFCSGNQLQAQSFNGTVYDIDTGRVQIVTGQVSKIQTTSEIYDEINARIMESRRRIQEDTDRIWAELAVKRAEYYMMEQNRLLRKIAEKE